MSTFPNLTSYLASEKLRLELFLRESDYLAGATRTLPMHISKGHLDSVAQSVQDAYRKKPLSVERVKEWVKGMAPEAALTEETERQISDIVENILNNIHRPRHNYDVKETVALMSKILAAMGSKSFFETDNGKLARLLVNYVATWHQIPVFTFEMQDRNAYNAMCSSEQSAQTYLIQKIQEAVFDRMGRLLPLVKDDNLTCEYDDGQGHRLFVEWHELYK